MGVVAICCLEGLVNGQLCVAEVKKGLLLVASLVEGQCAPGETRWIV